MSIHFISGKPGGGKSLYGTRLILDELFYGHRKIITNVPLDLPALNTYVQKECGDRIIDVINRVWVLDDDQTAEFWTYRPNGVRIPRLNKTEWESGKLPSYKEANDQGIMYVIDEVHNFFGSRQWALTGRDVLFYLSQHRKLGDTVLCITQAIENVDKQFRSVTQDFTFIRNLSKERLGLFRLPGIFMRRTYNSPPSANSTPMESGTFMLDVGGIGSCYNTAVGVGIHARVGDRNERKKGLHWSYAVGTVVAIVVIVANWGPSALASFFKTPEEKGQKRVVSSSKGSPLLDPGSNVQPGQLTPPMPVSVSGPIKRGPELSTNVWLTGVTTIGKQTAHFLLSNGAVLKFPQDKEISDVGPNFIVWRGVRYEWKTRL